LRRLEILLIAICIVATLGLSLNSARNNNAMGNGEFQRLTESTIIALEDRMLTYVQSLNGAAAFFSSSDSVSIAEFDNYVDTLNIAEYLPGINGIGFIEPFEATDEAAFLDRMRDMGLPDFEIRPDTTGPERFVIRRISPLEPNKEALGLDITFEVGRRTAAQVSRETRTPQLTPRILLVQDATKEPGFVLLRPLYWEDAIVRPPGAPEEGFRGWVYAPFVGNNLLNNLTASVGTSFQFEVFDGRTTDPETRIFASDRSSELNGRYTATYEIEKFGRIWTVAFASTPFFERGFYNLIPYAILLVGALLTAMLIYTVRNHSIRTRALADLAAIRARQISAREQENRSVVENAVTAVLILSADQKVIFANQAAQTCFGYGPGEMQGLTFTDFVTDLDVPAEDHNAKGLTQTGEELVLDLQRNSWKTSEGVPRITAIVRDLTKLHAAQREVQKTKTSYDLALKGGQIGVFDVDLRTGKSEVSDTWRDLLAVPADIDVNPQEIFLSRVHPDDLPILKAADEACIEGNTRRSISEFRMAFPGGIWRWMRSDAVVVERDATGKAVRLIGTQTDVTDLRHARNALESSEQRFRQLLAAAPIGMALMTEDGRFTAVNAAFCNLVGEDEQKLLTQKTLTDLMPQDAATLMYDQIREMVSQDDNAIYTAEHLLHHSSGEDRWGLFNISWTFDKNLGGNAFIAQINDITDKKKLEQAKNQFVSTVSHELRTPLTSIKGALGIITGSDKGELSAGNKRLIEIARSNTDRLTAIVNDILDLEKISSGEISFDFHPEDMGDLIKQSVQELAPYAITHKNTLSIEVPDTPLMVWADMGRTKQVLFNLISNACKYSSDDTDVLIRAKAVDGRAIVYVQNHGPGIPESFRPKMFGAFSQVDSSDTRAKGGTGLGLNITKQIVSRHDGTINFESQPNGVTVFWFSYQLYVADDEQTVVPEQVNRNIKGSRPRVMHFEDDHDFAEIVRSSLSGVADIVNVTTVAAARKIMEDGNFDVIILDWSLPDGDAISLLDDIDQSVRVFGLSAASDMRSHDRLVGNLVKSRTDLKTIENYVLGSDALVS
jgi:PAS domain S-box-containing protein